LADLVKDGFLEYLEENQEGPMAMTPIEDQEHEVPVHGEVNTISVRVFRARMHHLPAK